MKMEFDERIISLSQMRNIVKQNENRLPALMANYGVKVVVEYLGLQHLEVLKKNYHTLISAVLSEHTTPQINNLSLHLIATISSGYLRFNRLDAAKEILKKSEPYMDTHHADPLLLTVCLNNLAAIQKLKNKYFKSLRYSLKALQIMQNHIDSLRNKKQKKRLQQDTVVFLIVVIRCKSTLSKILDRSDAKYFKRAYELMNYLGYRDCLKYLGHDSIFMKYFTPVERQFHLPVFKTERESTAKENENQKLILQQLGKIHDILKTKQQPDVIVFNTQNYLPEPREPEKKEKEQIKIVEPLKITEDRPKTPRIVPKQYSPPIPPRKEQPVIPQTPQAPNLSISQQLQKIQQQKSSSIQIQPSPVRKQQTPQYIPSQIDESQNIQQPIIAQQTIFIDKWQLKIRHEKMKNEPIGNLIIESWRMSANRKKKQSRMVQIKEEKLEKIISQVCLEDKIPYELANQNLDEEEFISHTVAPYLWVSQQGIVGIRPKSLGLLPPFKLRVFNTDSIIFLNHVRTNSFRISISPQYAAKSTYLNIQFSPQSLQFYFTFQSLINDGLTAIFKAVSQQIKGMPDNVKNSHSQCKVIKHQQLKQYICEIVRGFENVVLNRQDQTSVNEILDNQLYYYKYRQNNQKKQGVYFIIRYLPSIGSFDVYLQNNYQTYSPDGKIKARGNILYRSRQFLRDFGVPLRCSYTKNKLFAFIDIIAKKYALMTFDYALSESDYDAYVQNAILEFQIVQSSFKTKIYQDEDYYQAMTISLLTINNNFPIGLKVTDFSIDNVMTRGLFIHLITEEWTRPYSHPVTIVNKALFKTFISEFQYRRDYFIAEWLQRHGFDILMQRLLDPTDQLYFQINVNRFLRGKDLIQLFNDSISSSV